jgi:uncharacterized protein
MRRRVEMRGFKITKKQLVALILGNILLGIGIGIFKYSNMGNDPFSAMILSLYRYTPLSYAIFLILFNSVVFVFEFLYGKKYIGLGTIVNWFLLGYVVQYSIVFLDNTMQAPESFASRLLAVVIGVVVASFGLSLYQTASAGVAPFDSLSMIVKNRLSIPYFWTRIFFDAICALTAYLTGGLIGLGTLVCAFGLGPVVSFFNRTVTERLLGEQNNENI